MPNVVTSLARKMRTGRNDHADHGRHRRDGWFDEANMWHDAEAEAPVLADGTAS